MFRILMLGVPPWHGPDYPTQAASVSQKHTLSSLVKDLGSQSFQLEDERGTFTFLHVTA